MTRHQHSPSFPAFFVSADWSKNAGKRSVHVADLPARRIRWEESTGWTLKTLLQLAAELAQRGSVLVGVDAALGVPAGYWGAVRERDWGIRGRPANFIDWLSRLAPDSNFFEDVREPDEWDVSRPFFRVPGRHGGLRDFTSLFDDGFRRRIDKLTGAKPLFAVSGIPGTVGSGTRALWKELIPQLQRKRDFAVWPFEGDLPELLSRSRIVLAETYPGLAYAAALDETLPASQRKVAKTKPEPRRHACDALEAMPWVQEFDVDLGDLEPVRKDEDAFDSHLTAAAVLRCGLEGRALCDDEWIDTRAGGAMLLAGPVDPLQRARTLPARRPAVVKFSSKPAKQPALRLETAKPSARAAYPCPIPGCSKVFTGTRGGWDAHVASRRMHPYWHPGATNPDDRKRLFKEEFGYWFRR